MDGNAIKSHIDGKQEINYEGQRTMVKYKEKEEAVDIYRKTLSSREYTKRNILQTYIGGGQQGLSGAAARTGDLRKARNVKK